MIHPPSALDAPWRIEARLVFWRKTEAVVRLLSNQARLKLLVLREIIEIDASATHPDTGNSDAGQPLIGAKSKKPLSYKDCFMPPTVRRLLGGESD